ncbi:MAG TPA: pirin family protein [Dehalococcoidia bacterium]|nr:pirin family protein [Dehalococcoidia bacterium]
MAAGPDRAARMRIRRDSEIFETDGGWFHARWHFSFDRYYDPENMSVGALRVFNHDTLRPGATWPMHPHRDVEGVTYVPAGEFEHRDSLGNGGVLRAGGVQRMTLGSGAYHSESNHSQTEPMQFIQMWIMPARRGLPPSVEQRQYTEEDRRNRLLRILKPEGADGEGVTVHQDASVFVSRLEPGHAVAHEYGDRRAGYLYLISGEAKVDGETLSRGDAAKLYGPGRIEIRAADTTELVLVDVPEL